MVRRLDGHLVDFSAGNDGSNAYGNEIESRQARGMTRRQAMLRSTRFYMLISKLALTEAGSHPARNEIRDRKAVEIKAAKTHEERMAIAEEYHRSLEEDPIYFPGATKQQQEEIRKKILAVNRTALKFNKKDASRS